MENQEQPKTPILEVAWQKFAQLDDASVKRTAAYGNLRKWVAIFGVLATLFSILTAMYPNQFPAWGGLILKGLLIASPLIASGLAAYTNDFYSTGDWLVARAGAEEVLKDIYMYRTILRNNAHRRSWLEKRLGKIQRSVFSGMNGELVMESFKGTLPPAPRFSPSDPNSDDGFSDLNGDAYFKFRLENALNWHIKKVNAKQKERINLQRLIYVSSGVGAMLAAFGNGLSIWVALTASFTAAFMGWQQLKNLELVVRNYSKVIMELSIIADHWRNLEEKERTKSEFYRMVNATEDILWSRNVEYIKAMQEALKESSLDEEASLIKRVIEEQQDADKRFRKEIAEATVNFASETIENTTDAFVEKFNEVLGSLSEEASSDVVQAELAAMKEAFILFTEKVGLSNSLQKIAGDFEGVEVGSNTPKEVLNEIISRYPKTDEAKG